MIMMTLRNKTIKSSSRRSTTSSNRLSKAMLQGQSMTRMTKTRVQFSSWNTSALRSRCAARARLRRSIRWFKSQRATLGTVLTWFSCRISLRRAASTLVSSAFLTTFSRWRRLKRSIICQSCTWCSGETWRLRMSSTMKKLFGMKQRKRSSSKTLSSRLRTKNRERRRRRAWSYLSTRRKWISIGRSSSVNSAWLAS